MFPFPLSAEFAGCGPSPAPDPSGSWRRRLVRRARRLDTPANAKRDSHLCLRRQSTTSREAPRKASRAEPRSFADDEILGNGPPIAWAKIRRAEAALGDKDGRPHSSMIVRMKPSYAQHYADLRQLGHTLLRHVTAAGNSFAGNCDPAGRSCGEVLGGTDHGRAADRLRRNSDDAPTLGVVRASRRGRGSGRERFGRAANPGACAPRIGGKNEFRRLPGGRPVVKIAQRPFARAVWSSQV
jgi:hypothetical protein